MSQKIMDLRCRPAFLHKFFGAEPGSPEHASARWLNRLVDTRSSYEKVAWRAFAKLPYLRSYKNPQTKKNPPEGGFLYSKLAT
ncbi:hypothetical protein BVZ28_18525 [Alcaligenes faecalis]|nr:hypothetical protein BVZ28_18525 [Alcaligenes faecalis]OSZ38184.1 hypothetical protein BVZ29_18695 [Alcaligenes faecalis]